MGIKTLIEFEVILQEFMKTVIFRHRVTELQKFENGRLSCWIYNVAEVGVVIEDSPPCRSLQIGQNVKINGNLRNVHY